MTTKELTEQQELLLEHLFGAARGDLKTAMRMAGYSDNYMPSRLANILKDEIQQRTLAYLSRNSPKAAVTLVELMGDAPILGYKEKLAAVKDLLDRTGFKPKDETPQQINPIFILPPKSE